MRPLKSLVIGVALAIGFGAVSAAQAQSWKPPADSQRCPSKWGAGDQRGSGNHMKAESVLKATRLFTKLGVENVGSLIGRGVLVDIAALKGVDMLPDTYEITVQDLQGALQRQRLTLQPFRNLL